MASLDWSYHRNGCRTCARTQDFLKKHKLGEPKIVLDARKNRLSAKDAIKMARAADKLYVAKGTKVVYLDMKKDKPDDDTLAGLLMGPTGNMRAPTLRVGKTLLVGFDESAYKEVLCR
jgi:arsenate reductase-like glutaredoxin family protein